MSYRAYDDGTVGRLFERPGATVRTLIFITVGCFVVQFFLLALLRVNLSRYFGVRADDVVERLRVWQIFTYMFLHDTGMPLHIIFNMIFLYQFGVELEQILGRRRFLIVYFGGGLAGGLAYCATQYLVQNRVPAIGASAAVMAVLVVYAFYFPNRTLLFFFLVPMSVKWAVVLFIGLDLMYSVGTYGDGVAHTAHLGGALFGFLYWRFYPAAAQFFDRVEDRQREREAHRLADDERRMDEILAKISREGFGSLTRRERHFLDEQSRRRRDRGFRG